MSGTTPKGAMLARIFEEAGAKPYPTTQGAPATSKVVRLLTPTGNPIVIQINNKTPRVWFLPEHGDAAFNSIGQAEAYDAGRTRHHHLNQVREFVGRALTKIAVESENWDDIRRAVRELCSARKSVAHTGSAVG